MTDPSVPDRPPTAPKGAVPTTVPTVPSPPIGGTVVDGVTGAEESSFNDPTEPDPALVLSCEQRIRQQIAAARQRTQQNADTRAAFAQNRAAGIRARHALREARARLTARHTLPPASPNTETTVDSNIRYALITDPTRQHAYFWAVRATGWTRFREAVDRDELLTIEPFDFGDPRVTAATETWITARIRETGKPTAVMVGSVDSGQWINWNLDDTLRPPVPTQANPA